jgi:hypothetical protein
MRLPQGCVARAATLYGLFLSVVVGVPLVGGHAFAAWRLRSERVAWAETGTSMNALAIRYPAQRDSASARGLDRITRRLGIRVVRDDAQPGTQVDDMKLVELLNRYMATMRQSSDDSLAAPEAPLEAFLDAHRAHLDSVSSHLRLSSDPITWEVDLDAGPQPPQPSLLAHRTLHTLLLLEGVRRLRRGEATGADDMLYAAWRQRQTLVERPEVISQLIAIALAGNEQAVLRRWRQPPPAWKDRTRQDRFRDRFVESIQADVYGWLVLTREYRGAADLDAGPRSAGLLDWGVRIGTVPYMRLAVAGISRHVRRGRELILADVSCSRGSDALGQEVLQGISRWETIPRTAVPSLIRAWTSAVRADLDSELTALVFEAREGVPASTVNVPSGVCRGLQWLQEPAPGGGWSIRAELAPELVREDGQWSFTLARGR